MTQEERRTCRRVHLDVNSRRRCVYGRVRGERMLRLRLMDEYISCQPHLCSLDFYSCNHRPLECVFSVSRTFTLTEFRDVL